jgi:CO dehydrogenase nickel-insertion accessory protein CooC1
MISEGKSKRVAITGLGGVGKIQVALELAYRVRDKRPEYSVSKSVEQAYMNISEQLGLRNVTPAEVKSLVKSYLRHGDVGQWLLIYDNMDDMDMRMTGSNVSPALKSFLPQPYYLHYQEPAACG